MNTRVHVSQLVHFQGM